MLPQYEVNMTKKQIQQQFKLTSQIILIMQYRYRRRKFHILFSKAIGFTIDNFIVIRKKNFLSHIYINQK